MHLLFFKIYSYIFYELFIEIVNRFRVGFYNHFSVELSKQVSEISWKINVNKNKLHNYINRIYI